MHRGFFRSQIRTTASLPTNASRAPSGENEIDLTQPTSSVRQAVSVPVAGSHIRMLWSIPALASMRPSGEKARALVP